MNTLHRRPVITAAAALIVTSLGGTPSVHAQIVHYSVSTSYSAGSYIFSGNTWSAAMFHGLTVQTGRFTLSASLPIVAQNNTALSYIGGVIVPTGGPDNAAVAERQKGQPVQMGKGSGSGSGQGGLQALGALAVAPADTLTVAEPGGTAVHVGDPFFSAGVELYHGTGTLRSMSVQGFAKAPMASVASGVSTGQWDYGGGASLSLGAGRTFFFGDASYWVLGDMPTLQLLDNVVYGAGIGQTSEDGKWSVLGSVSGSSAVIRNVTPPASLGVSVGYLQSESQSVTLGAHFGLTESAPQFGLSLGWRVRLSNAP